MIVGQIAVNEIQQNHPELSDQLETLRKNAQTYFTGSGKPFKSSHFDTIAQASSFLDTYSDYYLPSKPWHYVNAPVVDEDDLTSINMNALSRDLSKNPRSTIEILDSLEVLKKSQSQIAAGHIEDTKDIAFAFVKLLHLVGDIHQPLHNVSCFSKAFPNGDRGGNSFKLKDHGELHAFWDSMGGIYKDVRWEDDKAIDSVKADTEAVVTYAQSHAAPADVHTVSETMSVLDWSAKLRFIAQNVAYHGVTPGGAVSSEYKETVQNYSRQLVYLAGKQLAKMLASVLKSDAGTLTLSRNQIEQAHFSQLVAPIGAENGLLRNTLWRQYKWSKAANSFALRKFSVKLVDNNASR